MRGGGCGKLVQGIVLINFRAKFGASSIFNVILTFKPTDGQTNRKECDSAGNPEQYTIYTLWGLPCLILPVAQK